MVLAVLGATIVGFMMGLAGTATGGMAVLSFSRPSRRTQTLFLGFSAGVMLVVVFFDLLPEAWRAGGWPLGLLGAFVGLFMVQTIDHYLAGSSPKGNRGLSRFTRAGLLLGLGIALHNFPEGVALGTVYTASKVPGGWISLALLMALHNIPEGMVLATSMRLANARVSRVMLALVLVEVPMGLGATVGGIFGEISAAATALSLGFAGGAMLYITVDELLPAARELAGIMWTIAGMAGGTAVGLALTHIL